MVSRFQPLNMRYFNMVLNSGIIPDSWLHVIGVIQHLFKIKGDINEMNY